MRNTVGSPGAIARTRRIESWEKLMTRTRESLLAARPRQAEAPEQGDRALLDERAVAGRVLGLDREPDLALGVDHELEQPFEGEHAAAVLVDHHRVVVDGLAVAPPASREPARRP